MEEHEIEDSLTDSDIDLGIDTDLPFGDVCPLCGEEWCTMMQPRAGSWGDTQFQPIDPIEMCVFRQWVVIHEGNVEIEVLSGWDVHRNAQFDADYSFVYHPRGSDTEEVKR